MQSFHIIARRNHLRTTLCAISCCILSMTASAATNAPPAESDRSMEAFLIPEPPRIDGQLDEPSWALTQPTSGFTQNRPATGSPSSETSHFWVGYDKHNVYIAAKLEDSSANGATCRLTRRDRDSESDWFGVVIDAFHDRKTGRAFMVNASGVQRDATIANDTQMDTSWDAVWESAVLCSREGWTLEMRIPFTALRFNSSDAGLWGFNALRYISSRKEESWWNPVPRNENRMMSAAGELKGISTAQAPRRLVLIPYAASMMRLDSEPSASERLSIAPNVGMDLQVGLTSETTLDATLNPDFGQVEVDEAVINLSAFETFFPEKRPFFLEGADVFATASTNDDSDATRLFYSRRIGQNEPIIAAAKLAGRFGENLSLGILDAFTGFALARELNPALSNAPTGATHQALVRARQELSADSYVGGLFTAFNQPGDTRYNAYTGTVDTILKTKDARFSLAGLVAGSTYTLDMPNPSTGGSSVESRQGGFLTTTLNKEGGKNHVGAVHFEVQSPDFQANDLGYNQRTDFIGGWLWNQVRELNGFGPFQEFRANTAQWYYAQATTGLPESAGGNINVNLLWRNYWFSNLGAGVDASVYDRYEVETGGHIFKRPTKIFAFGGVESDSRKPVTGNLFLNAAVWEQGAWTVSGAPALTAQLGEQGELSAGFSAKVDIDTADWAFTLEGAEPNGTAIFGKRDTYQASAFAKGAYTFSDKLSLQFFGQLYTLTGIYSDYSQLDDDGLLSPYTGTCGGSCPDPNFNAQYFNTNAILRWEYRPGSTLYAVWTQNRALEDQNVTQPLLDAVSSNFAHGAENSFVVKLSYRWGT